MYIEQNDLVLFQGDSITHWGRNDENPNDLGTGYVYFASSLFSALHPDMNVNFINRGISGNRTCDLVARWTEDCINLKPNVLSILIGINDTWKRYSSDSPTSTMEYKQNYTSILERVKNELPDTKLIIMEPFVLPCPDDRKVWREDLDPKITVASELAKQFGALYIPLDSIFASATKSQPPEFWAGDGVHPSPAGHVLIAHKWLKAIDAI